MSDNTRELREDLAAELHQFRQKSRFGNGIGWAYEMEEIRDHYLRMADEVIRFLETSSAALRSARAQGMREARNLACSDWHSFVKRYSLQPGSFAEELLSDIIISLAARADAIERGE